MFTIVFFSGITVAGYVCEREDLSGIFVKSLNENSDAFKCGKIHVNDRIIEVDDQSLQNCSNYEAVKRLKETGDTVTITFERYISGPKYEQLQEAFAEKIKIKDSSPTSVTTLSWIPIENSTVSCNIINDELPGYSLSIRFFFTITTFI